jgi:methionyl-tRNA formyltransferase
VTPTDSDGLDSAKSPAAPRAPLAVPPLHARRLIYLGTPQVAVASLRALVAAGFEIAAVVTNPDRRRGRGSQTAPSPVKAAALELGLPVVHDVNDALDMGAELGVVVAFGQLIRRRALEQVAFVNLHFSLLPRWRGAAPVERALLAGDSTTGVDLMGLEVGLDTGPIYARRAVAIAPDDTLDSLRARLVDVGTALLVDTLTAGLHDPTPQRGEPTYATKIDPAELRLDWTRPAIELDRLVRLGGAWTTFRGKRLKIVTANLNGDDLDPVVVQPEGKAPMAYSAWRNGVRATPTEHLGS